MKTTIKISVLLNAALLGTAVFLWEHPRTILVSAPSTPAVATTVEPQTAPAPVVQTVAAPFHWDQLMSTNGYRTFVANLRAAGCPESTVDDIVRGNIQRAFDWKREELHVDGSVAGPWSVQAQAQMVAYFLGQAPVPEQEVASTTALPSPAEQPVIPMQVSMQDMDPATLAALNLSDEQKQMITEVQRNYSVAMNGQKQMAANGSQSSQPSQSSQDQAGNTTQNLQNPGISSSPQQAQPGANNTPQQGQPTQAQIDANTDTALEGALGADGYLGYKIAQEQTALENQLKQHPSWVSGDSQ
ncbi:MAG TPA: hypothetical protein VMH87_19400 [Pseudomonadales bacterium]|nr:hypothetical protein [Pseudomonadales bacterium]